jgi:chemotaxis protein MotB
MKNIMFQKMTLSILLLLPVLLQSCVSSKKYNAANQAAQDMSSKNNELQQQVDAYKQQVDSYKQQVNELGDHNKTLQAEFTSFKAQCENMEHKLNSYQDNMEEEMKTIKGVHDIIEQGVAEFEGHGVEIQEKNGQIHVNLEDKLLYKSRGTTISPGGLKVLENLSGALNKYPNMQVIIVGHTDNAEFKGDMKGNLNLSTQRANGVVSILVGKYSVTPERILSAGQGKYAPIADNSTGEGRAKNRRIEIILNPNVEKIWEAAQSNNY